MVRTRQTAWQEWVAENLARGVAPSKVEVGLRKAGVPKVRAARLVRSAARNPVVVAARQLCRTHGALLSVMDTRSAPRSQVIVHAPRRAFSTSNGPSALHVPYWVR